MDTRGRLAAWVARSFLLSFASAFMWIVGWQVAASLPPRDEGSGFMGFAAVIIAPPVCFLAYPAMFFLLSAMARALALKTRFSKRFFIGLGGFCLLVGTFLVLNRANPPSSFHTSIATPQAIPGEWLQGAVVALTPLVSWLLYCFWMDDDGADKGEA